MAHQMQGEQQPGVPAEVVASYRRAIYVLDWIAIGVDGKPQTVELKLDEPSEVLGALFNMTGCMVSAFITAHNPHGQRLSPQENAERHLELEAEIKAAGFRALTGRGMDPNGKWPAEESLLVLSISREAAIAVGNRFQQNAIICAGDDFVPRLQLLCSPLELNDGRACRPERSSSRVGT